MESVDHNQFLEDIKLNAYFWPVGPFQEFPLGTQILTDTVYP